MDWEDGARQRSMNSWSMLAACVPLEFRAARRNEATKNLNDLKLFRMREGGAFGNLSSPFEVQRVEKDWRIASVDFHPLWMHMSGAAQEWWFPSERSLVGRGPLKFWLVLVGCCVLWDFKDVFWEAPLRAVHGMLKTCRSMLEDSNRWPSQMPSLGSGDSQKRHAPYTCIFFQCIC